MSRELVLVVSDAPEPADLAPIRQGLDRYNKETSGISDRHTLAVFARDPDTHDVVGGVIGRTSRGLLFIDVFYLPESLRGKGLGSALLGRMEAEGRLRGCYNGILDTNSFQAPEFYKRNGWQLFGAIDCEPPGTQRMFFTKRLLPES
jgi:GNAT superfamily N-acetyltransferase